MSTFNAEEWFEEEIKKLCAECLKDKEQIEYIRRELGNRLRRKIAEVGESAFEGKCLVVDSVDVPVNPALLLGFKKINEFYKNIQGVS